MNELLSLLGFFARISLLAVGGGNATLPEIQQQAVAAGWATDQAFVQIYSMGQIAPGPSTMYVAGIGFSAAGIAGGFIAGLAFVLPSSILVVCAGTAWTRWKPSPLKTAVRSGLAPVSIALVTVGAWNLIRAVSSMSQDTRQSAPVALTMIIGIAALVAVLAQFKKINPTFLILGGGLAGFLLLA